MFSLYNIFDTKLVLTNILCVFLKLKLEEYIIGYNNEIIDFLIKNIGH